ncbi:MULTISPECIES: nucleotide sugar dehydrogenase [Mammaliicoccus]|nr:MULTISPECIES: nucleotide sugar dehydrogenase [Mammaliicoccus]MEB7725166.1 nucleotide sugar dehydrogenase [Mammaliicoccus fleurettii]PTE31419.1 UDP-N-acetyl-D-mannosamine dehydrogenase [Mammaliicoccus fleurettii]
MKITTIGLGYIGLPTSIMFAKHGVNVIGVDINSEAVSKLNNGELHIEEPYLHEELLKALESNTFRATTEVEPADCFIISVPTPNSNDEYKSCDVSIVESACRSILPVLEKGNTVIIESTIAPRTTEDVIKPIFEEVGYSIGEDLYLIHCPERVLPGKIMEELKYNNRIVGGITRECTTKAKEIYSLFVEGEIIETDSKTAELSKLMENTFRDTNIALANELAKICYELDINALKVIEMANKHPRVNLHYPGPGVGGHCLAVDPYFIIAKAPEKSELISKSREINNSMPSFIVDIVKKLVNKNNFKKITVLGLTYKGNIDDIRESPAMDIYHMLQKNLNIDIVAHDPHVQKSFVTNSIEEAVNDSSLLLVLSDHDEFKDLSNYSKLMDNPVILDTKNVVVKHDGYKYYNYDNLYKLK